MFTVCPKCTLTLVVTVADLRAGQGYVRCGRCSSVFNALLTLTEERDLPPPPYTSATATQSRPALQVEHAPAEESAAANETKKITLDDTLDLGEPLISENELIDEPIPDAALEFDPTSADLSEVFVEAKPRSISAPEEITGTFETIVIKSEDGEEQESTELEHDREDEIDAELRAIVSQLSGTAFTRHDADDAGGETHTSETAIAAESGTELNDVSASAFAIRAAQEDEAPLRTLVTNVTPEETTPESTEEALAAPETLFEQPEAPRNPWARVAWGGGITVLALALIVQVAHHYRHEIAALGPGFNRAMSAAYAALGWPLVPRWNLEAYEVRQLGASAAPDDIGRLTVRASVLNGAKRPQPAPYLRITLQDRFGNAIAAGDVPPQAYLPQGIGSTYLSAGQRIDAEITLADPGQQAVGFEIDVCLPASGGGVTCANDSGL